MNSTPTARQLSAALRKAAIPFTSCRSVGFDIMVLTDADHMADVADLMSELGWSAEEITTGRAYVSAPAARS